MEIQQKLDLVNLYTQPFLDKLNSLEQQCHTLQDFSIQIKLSVIEQKLQSHQKALQQLKQMKMGCLQLKEEFCLLDQQLCLQNQACDNVQSMNNNIQSIQQIKHQINHLMNKKQDIQQLVNFVVKDGYDISLYSQLNLEKLVMQINSQFLKSTDSNKVNEFAKRVIVEKILLHLIKQKGKQEQDQLIYILQQINSRALQEYVTSLSTYLLIQENRNSQQSILFQLSNAYSPVKYKQLLLQLFNNVVVIVTNSYSQSINQENMSQSSILLQNQQNIQYNTQLYELVYQLYNQYKYFREYFTQMLQTNTENPLLFNQLTNQFFNNQFNTTINQLQLLSNKQQQSVQQIVNFLSTISQINRVLTFFANLKPQQLVDNSDIYKELIESEAFDQYPVLLKDYYNQNNPLQDQVKQLLLQQEQISDEQLITQTVGQIKQLLTQKLSTCFSSADPLCYVNQQVAAAVGDSMLFSEIQLLYIQKLQIYLKEMRFDRPNCNLLLEKEKLTDVFDVLRVLKVGEVFSKRCSEQKGTVLENVLEFYDNELFNEAINIQKKYLNELCKIQFIKQRSVLELKEEFVWLGNLGTAGEKWDQYWIELQNEFKSEKEKQSAESQAKVYEFQL